jgi:hypothetical protein
MHKKFRALFSWFYRALLLMILFLGLASFIACGGSDAPAPQNSSVPNPTVTGPIQANAQPGDPSHGYPFSTSGVDLASYGYIEEEFFIEGTANRYNTPPKQTGSIIDGGYPYKTRIVVRRPVSPRDFNGVVLLEWQNPATGSDLDAIWNSYMLRSGYAWVGVTVHQTNIHGSVGLKWWSPIRYATLNVLPTVNGLALTDDSLMHDIYSQAAKAIRNPVGIDMMKGLPVKTILTVAASGGAVVIYYNSIHPLHNMVDGFYMVRGGYGTRTDINSKVFHVVSEREVVSQLPKGREPDSDRLRTWEIAGGAHFGYFSYMSHLLVSERDGLPGSQALTGCTLPPLGRIPDYYVGPAVIDHLVRWVNEKISPPMAPPLEVESMGPPSVLARDSYGNALGGIRLPQHAVPTAMNTGINTGAGWCSVWGAYVPFDDATLDALYPSHNAYVSLFNHSVEENLKAGFIVAEDAQAMEKEAAYANIPPN